MTKVKFICILVLVFSLTGAFSVNMLGDNQTLENGEPTDTEELLGPGLYAACAAACMLDTSFYVPINSRGYRPLLDTCMRDNCE